MEKRKSRLQGHRPYLSILFSFLLFVSPGCKKTVDESQNYLLPGTHDLSLVVDGRTRTYRIHVPGGFDATAALPLVIALHGGGGTAQVMEILTGFSPLADRQNFFVAYPNGFADNHWADGRGMTQPEIMGVNDVNFISLLIDEIGKLVRLDTRRVYVCGFSNGSMMTNFLACELSAKIAAFGGVSGQLAEIKKNLHPASPLGVIYIHGTADPVVPYTGGLVLGPNGGYVLSVAELMTFWVNVDGTSAIPVIETMPDKDPFDGTRVIHFSFNNGNAGTQVHLYRIEDGTHTWPGSNSPGVVCKDINASEVIWSFFKTQSK
jgi:polyhydroxybutyrate depolymerase